MVGNKKGRYSNEEMVFQMQSMTEGTSPGNKGWKGRDEKADE